MHALGPRKVTIKKQKDGAVLTPGLGLSEASVDPPVPRRF